MQGHPPSSDSFHFDDELDENELVSALAQVDTIETSTPYKSFHMNQNPFTTTTTPTNTTTINTTTTNNNNNTLNNLNKNHKYHPIYSTTSTSNFNNNAPSSPPPLPLNKNSNNTIEKHMQALSPLRLSQSSILYVQSSSPLRPQSESPQSQSQSKSQSQSHQHSQFRFRSTRVNLPQSTNISNKSTNQNIPQSLDHHVQQPSRKYFIIALT